MSRLISRKLILPCLAAGLMFGGKAWGQTRVWTDSVGAHITLHGTPRRVVSLAPSLTEDVFAVGAGGQLVGDTNYCVHPAAARTKVKVGSMLQPSAEIIVRLHPDLVLATQDGDSAVSVANLKRLGIPVYTFGSSSSYAAIRQNFFTLGAMLGHSAAAQAQMRVIDGQLAAIHRKVGDSTAQRVFLQLGVGSLYTANRQTFLSDMLQAAGAVNVMAALPVRYPQVAREAVIAANPDAILVTLDPSPAMLARAAADWARFGQMRAVRQHHVFGVNAELFNLPTPMTYLAAVCAAVHRLHPRAGIACSEEAPQ